MVAQVTSGGTTVGPLAVWNALRAAGASAVQAAGIMGNIQSESSFNPEANAMDSNGLRSYGLFQQNGNYGYLVTGDPVADMNAQIALMVKNGGLGDASGGTPAEAGSNFAHGYERCAACGYQGGSGELSTRGAQAEQWFTTAQQNSWNTAGGGSSSSSAGGGSSSGGSSSGSGCVISMPVTGGCILTKSNLKALKGGLLIAAGGALLLTGGLVLVAFGLQRSGAARTASRTLQTTGLGKVAKLSRRTVGSTGKAATQKPSARLRPLPADVGGQVEESRDEGDELFELTRGSGRANRAGYRRAMAGPSDTPDLRRKTA